MTGYVLSREADQDVEGILRFTIERWGDRQAERYGAALHATFDLLSSEPGIGRWIDHIRGGYRRFEHASHSIYYREAPEGITIVRVLHRRMLHGGRI